MIRKFLFMAATAITIVTAPSAHADPRSASQYSSNTNTTSYERTSTNYNRNKREDVKTDPGFYLGAYGGYGWSDLDASGGNDFDINGWDYGVFTGLELDALMDRADMNIGLHGAIEAFYGWSGADDEDATGIDAEKDHEWGVNFRPGLAFIDDVAPFGVKPYGIIGYRRANYEFSPGDDENYNGFELGIGTELVAYDNFGVRLDYSHVWYGEKNGVDPDENDLRLGVAYHF